MSRAADGRRLSIPESELTWRFSRSSGPGGQSVNTTDSRVELMWDVSATTILSDSQRTLAIRRLHGRSVDGVVTMVASQYKSQHRNREDAKVRLELLVARAIVPPKKRRPTKPSKAAQQRRITAKKQRGVTKQMRRRPNID